MFGVRTAVTNTPSHSLRSLLSDPESYPTKPLVRVLARVPSNPDDNAY